MTWTRRDFVRQSTAGLAAGLFGQPTGLFGHQARAELRFLRGDVGYYTNRGGTIGLLNTLNGCLIVDSQFPDTAEAFLVEMRDIGCRPVHALINTHHHGDHTGGNGVLRYVVRDLVAHANSLTNQRNAAVAAGTEAAQTYPDKTFTDVWTLNVAEEVVRGKYYGPAHTNGDITVFFEKANIVHLGDLVNNHGYPNVDGPAGASVQGWVRALEAISAEHSADTMYIFGHAEVGRSVTGAKADLLYQRDYFSAVLDAAQRGIREGKSRADVVAITTLPGFTDLGGTASRLGLGLGVAYDELAAGTASR